MEKGGREGERKRKGGSVEALLGGDRMTPAMPLEY